LAAGYRGELYELMANVAAYSGLRWGELAALTVPQIDSAARAFTIDRKIVEVAGQLYLEAPKNRKRRRTIYPRRTPAGHPLADRLAARIEVARAEQEVGANPLGLIFPSPKGTYWRSSNFNRRVLAPAYLAAGWRDAEGNGGWTWHQPAARVLHYRVVHLEARPDRRIADGGARQLPHHARDVRRSHRRGTRPRPRGHRVAILSHWDISEYLTVLLAASPWLPTVDCMTSSHPEASPPATRGPSEKGGPRTS
jgi:hypothetical protein